MSHRILTEQLFLGFEVRKTLFIGSELCLIDLLGGRVRKSLVQKVGDPQLKIAVVGGFGEAGTFFQILAGNREIGSPEE